MMNTAHNVVVITGASSGIGAALAKSLADSGRRVALLSRRADRLRTLVGEIGGERAMGLVTDVTDCDSVMNACAQIISVWGTMGTLVNNAGVYPPEGPLWELSPRDWAAALATNLTGTYHCIREIVPFMLKRGYGRVLNISSQMVAVPQAIAYSVTKNAVDLLTELLARELAERSGDFRCWALDPGNIRTEMNPGGTNDPVSVAVAICDLLDHPHRVPSGKKITVSP